MKREIKNKVEWFLRFLNLDFRSESAENKIYFLRDMHNFFGECLHPDLSSMSDMIRDIEDIELAKVEIQEGTEILRDLQSKLQKFMDGLKNRYAEIEQYKGKDAKYYNYAVPSNIIELRTLGHLEINVKAEIMLRNKPKIERSPKNRQWRIFWEGDTLEKSPIKIVITPKEGNEAFLFRFAQTLSGIPLTSLKLCSECKNWYLQSGRLEKLFCSNQCRSRYSARKKRKEIREEGGEKLQAYRENAAKRARKSYEKKRKEEFGPNVKIKRKKTKEKNKGE